jgi:hypothetical protein
MGEMKRGEAWQELRRVRDSYASTLVIAAAINSRCEAREGA